MNRSEDEQGTLRELHRRVPRFIISKPAFVAEFSL